MSNLAGEAGEYIRPTPRQRGWGLYLPDSQWCCSQRTLIVRCFLPVVCLWVAIGVQRKSSAPKPSWPVESGWHPRKLGNKYCLDTDCISYNWSFTSRCEDADSLWCPDGKALRHLGWGREGPGRDWGALSQEGQGEVAWTGRQRQEFQGRVGSHWVKLCGSRRGLFISVCKTSYLKRLGSDW